MRPAIHPCNLTFALHKWLILVVLCFLLLLISPTVTAQPTDLPRTHLIVFHRPSCPHCREVIENVLPPLQDYYNERLVVQLYDVDTSEGLRVYQLLHDRFPQLPTGVPQGYIDEYVLVGSDQFHEVLPGLIDTCLAKGGTDWPFVVTGIGTSAMESEAVEVAESQAEAILSTTAAEMSARFAGLSAVTVAASGLLDGINPCAFTTIIFFISYLTLVGRRRREILGVGASFTLAVFLSYLALGLGLGEIVQRLSGISLIARLIYAASLVVCLALAILSLVDYVRVRRGRSTEIMLQLPRFLKQRIHKVIREESRTRAYVVGAFVTGVLVSVFELACTGQVYLPMLVFMTGIAEARASAWLYLVLYNVMFVVPLIVVFTVVYMGTTSQQITVIFQRHMGMVKLLTAGLFGGLALWLASILSAAL
jgi:cytochrome c biogenesis protein CcdA